MNELVGKRIKDLKTLLQNKSVSAKEIFEAHAEQIAKHDSKIQAFNCLTLDLAREQAKNVDALIARGEVLPPLAGIPVAIKDNMCVPGYPTTCSSRSLENFIPSYHSTAVKRLFDAGAICMGKTNLDEFAMGSSTENSAFRKTRNPWNTDCVPGGSSGGSAAAVSANFSVISLGSDTGGSIRQPAAFCGVVGMKPTYGTVSRYGLVAFASSLDQIGPFARSVEDAAITLSVISGTDERDSTSLRQTSENAEFHYDFSNLADGLSAPPAELLAGLRVGVLKELVGEGIDDDVRKAVLDAAEGFRKLGADVVEVSLPTAKHALPVYYIIATAEASANLARFDGLRYGYRNEAAKDLLSMYMTSRQYGFGDEVKRRIMLGTYALSSGYYDAYYKKAQQVRRLMKDDFDTIFGSVDIILCPTAPLVAFPVGEKMDDPLAMYLTDIATIPANLAGLPGISLPAGLSKNGLPLGVQLLAKPLADRKLLRAAAAFEQMAGFLTAESPVL